MADDDPARGDHCLFDAAVRCADEPGLSLVFILHAHLPWVPADAPEDDAGAKWLREALADSHVRIAQALENLARDGVPFQLGLSVSAPLAAMWKREAPELISRVLALRGSVELFTCTATHGYLPLLDEVSARAQVSVAARAHADLWGAAPCGLWLAECGYQPGHEALLSREGLSYFFVDTHAVDDSSSAVRLPNGVVALARDQRASEQVWSAQVGYPGDPAYLDFHHRDGGRRTRAVGGGAWNEAAARAKAKEHAAHFVESIADRPGLVVAPYDAELFGHWWFEGPWFLEEVFRAAAALKVTTLSPVAVTEAVAGEVRASSWGRGGHSAVWVDPSNAWLLPHLHRAGQKLSRAVEAGGDPRVLRAAATQLLLAQASDWPFLLEAKVSTGYAATRVEGHLLEFNRLMDGNLASLSRLEAANNLFPALDPNVYRRGPRHGGEAQ